jgi:CTP:molybdopterin cytidylyltransferase MocA
MVAVDWGYGDCHQILLLRRLSMGCILKLDEDLDNRVTIGAVLLAAGSGSRMGHRPKSLLELDGVPLICRQLIALSGAGVDEVVVVLGHYADRIEEAVKEFPVTLLRNSNPDAGQVSSLRLGLQALSSKLDAVLIALADQPLISSQDIRDLISAYKKRPQDTLVVQPSVEGLPGNPVIFSNEVRQQILLGDATVGCRQWQSANPSQVHPWVSSNNNYRTDVDTLEDIAALAARTGHQLKWPASQR